MIIGDYRIVICPIMNRLCVMYDDLQVSYIFLNVNTSHTVCLEITIISKPDL